MKKIPKSHPRYESLMTREKIVKGVELGITSQHGLIAQGRGEAFDYLIKERTTEKAKKKIKKAAKLLLKAKYPVISVNGNVAVLAPKEVIGLSKLIPAKLEVNIFHKSKEREERIKEWLIKYGAKEVLMPEKPLIKFIEHNRRFCNPEGIAKADVVFVPLEDGDRCKALIKMKKKVITVDLNPMSRTAKAATVTIVDNITRALPLLIEEIKKLK
ncbi:phosphopantothenate/pantothenate synthetase [Candidatus Woesearchaeota archaeon]|nr:phosphopantothenate/pantothenate synthetase [Candidatus Woesearchaeota archaeon]